MALRKIMVILFSVVVLCTSLMATTSAETMYLLTDEGITPAYEIASDLVSAIDISGNCACCKSETRGILQNDVCRNSGGCSNNGCFKLLFKIE